MNEPAESVPGNIKPDNEVPQLQETENTPRKFASKLFQGPSKMLAKVKSFKDRVAKYLQEVKKTEGQEQDKTSKPKEEKANNIEGEKKNEIQYQGWLPVPKHPLNWTIALFFIFISFAVYYIKFYPLLNESYLDETAIKSAWTNSNLNVNISVPKHISDFIARDIVFILENPSEKDQITTLTLSGTCKSEDGSTEVIEIYNATEDSNSSYKVSFAQVHLLSHSTSQLSFKILGGQCNKDSEIDLIFHLNNIQGIVNQQNWKPKFDPLHTFVYTGIKNLLLPPYSNGLIPATIFILVALVEALLKKTPLIIMCLGQTISYLTILILFPVVLTPESLYSYLNKIDKLMPYPITQNKISIALGCVLGVLLLKVIFSNKREQ